MRRFLLWVAVGVLGLVWAMPGVAVGQQGWTAPIVFSQATYEVTGQPAQFDVVQRVIDFPPGSGTPLHTHSGPQFAVVLSGDLAYRIYGKDDTYKPGKAWMEPTGEQHLGRNITTTNTRLVAAGLIPTGAPLTNNLEPTPAGLLPLVVPIQTTFPVTGSPSQFSVVQRVVDFPPGTGIGLHFHGGNQYVTVIEGEITLQMNGVTRIYKAGESWVEPTNVVHLGGNNGTTTARIMTTALLAPGAVYATTVDAPAAMPVTGGAPVYAGWLLVGWAALGLGLGLKGYRTLRRTPSVQGKR